MARIFIATAAATLSIAAPAPAGAHALSCLACNELTTLPSFDQSLSDSMQTFDVSRNWELRVWQSGEHERTFSDNERGEVPFLEQVTRTPPSPLILLALAVMLVFRRQRTR